jgi:hypothetical protein
MLESRIRKAQGLEDQEGLICERSATVHVKHWGKHGVHIEIDQARY